MTNKIPTCIDCGVELLEDEEDTCADCFAVRMEADAADRAYDEWKDRQLEEGFKHLKFGS